MIPMADRAGLAFYNEFNNYAADWLENLIENGLIAQGVVNRKSIKELEPDDVKGYTQCHFFAGIGGWSLAARMAGWDDSRPIWTGSAPCQPFSAAGKGEGTDDPRHLWPDFHRLIDAIRPACCVGEQVAGQIGYDWLDGVGADLETSAYEWRAVDIPSCAIDSPQQRQRLYWIAIAMAQPECAGWGAGSDGRSRKGAGADRGRASDQFGGSDGRGSQPLDRAQGTGLERQRRHSAAEGIGAGKAGSAAIANAGDLECAEGVGRGEGIGEHGIWRGGRGDAAACPDGEIEIMDGPIGIGRQAGGGDHRGNVGDIAGAGNQDGSQGPMASGHSDFERRVTPSRQLPIDEYHARSDRGRNRSWWGGADWIICHDEKARRVADASAPMLVNGIRGNLAIPRPASIGEAQAEAQRLISRIGAWSGFGNAIVPQLGAEVLGALMDILDQ